MFDKNKITICLYYHNPQARHVRPIYTGFRMLEKAKILELSLKKIGHLFDREKLRVIKVESLRKQTIFVEIRTPKFRKLCFYDNSDGSAIDENVLELVDYYFKRSLVDNEIYRSSKKILPLGLYYPVYPSFFDLKRIKRCMLLEGRYKKGLKSLLGCFPTVKFFDEVKMVKKPLKITFFAKAWESANDPNVKQLNEVRAEYIDLLRRKFKSNFMGGFIPDDYARKQFGMLLAPDYRLTAKKNYLRLVKNHSDICIATRGLHGSIGAKMAEYVALGKAIVTEKINKILPGNFSSGQNYLMFDSPEGCLEACMELMDNDKLRLELMTANRKYYWSHLRPSSQIGKTLQAVGVLKKGAIC